MNHLDHLLQTARHKLLDRYRPGRIDESRLLPGFRVELAALFTGWVKGL